MKAPKLIPYGMRIDPKTGERIPINFAPAPRVIADDNFDVVETYAEEEAEQDDD